jgi:hypothetical protein
MTQSMTPSKRPTIDPEFRDLLPPLAEEEREKLEGKLQLEGCLKPLVVWRQENVLLDGHHSLAIYEKHNIPYTVHYLDFPTRELAVEWAINNQLGRRNLTDERRAYYRGKKYLAQKAAHGGSERFVDSPSCHSDTMGDTAENIGCDSGVSRRTVHRDAAFAEGVDQLSPGAKEQVLSGQSDAPKAQIAAGLFCARCKRTGPAKDCPKCADLQAEAGKKSKRLKKSGAKKSGSVTFDFRAFDKHLGHVVRGIDELARAYPHVKASAELAEVECLRDGFGTAWKKLRTIATRTKE